MGRDFAAHGPPEPERRAIDTLLTDVKARVRKESGRWRGRLRR